jgi:hypothetical protein
LLIRFLGVFAGNASSSKISSGSFIMVVVWFYPRK